MKKYLLLTILLPLLGISCSSENEGAAPSDGKGAIALRSSIDMSVNDLTRTPVPFDDFDGYTLIVTDGVTEFHNGPVPVNGIVGDLPVGTYAVTLTDYSDSYTPAFTDPRYSGTTENVVVTASATPKEVSIALTQANAIVEIIFDESVAAAGLTGLSGTVTQGADALTYLQDNSTGKGYFAPGEAVVAVTDADSTVIPLDGEDEKTLELEAADYYRITLKAAAIDGAITITATIDTDDLNEVDEEWELDPVTGPTPDAVFTNSRFSYMWAETSAHYTELMLWTEGVGRSGSTNYTGNGWGLLVTAYTPLSAGQKLAAGTYTLNNNEREYTMPYGNMVGTMRVGAVVYYKPNDETPRQDIVFREGVGLATMTVEIDGSDVYTITFEGIGRVADETGTYWINPTEYLFQYVGTL